MTATLSSNLPELVAQNDERERVMSSVDHLLVTGGPGSGKTTLSILKAADVAEQRLRPGQRVLFISFARATVSRVLEAIEQEHEISPSQKKRIHVQTYHAFFWQIVKTHGYLAGLPRRLSILLPQNEAIALSHIRREYKAENRLDDDALTEKREREAAEKLRLALEDGRICFDLFAHFAGELLRRSKRIRELISLMYPYVVLDEFQDTNEGQWHVVKEICTNSTVCALADPEQRIYEWNGADPERIDHFRQHCQPTECDLGGDNHRSKGTDILMFGDDVLRKRFRQDSYVGIQCDAYEPNQNQAMAKVVTSTLQARARLLESDANDWSLAVLTPTKRLTRLVSDAFRSPPAKLAAIPHTAAVDVEGAILAAELLAYLMQPGPDGDHLPTFIRMLCDFYRGKGGDSPSKTSLDEAVRIHNAYNDYLKRAVEGKKIRGNSLLVATLEVYGQARNTTLSGDPDADWVALRRILDGGRCRRLKEVAEELRNVRLLDRGTQLRQALSQDWRDNVSYLNALEIVRQTFVQEHFSMARRAETGVIVMNMHKAKGKQFDEVIIFEGWPRFTQNEIVSNPDRIVRGNVAANDDDQARQNFRVSVTRGKQRVTILTPRNDPCILLLE